MDILILGNGFDLAHGLPTSYKDFLNYCLSQCNTNKVGGNSASIYQEFYETNLWLKHFLLKKNKVGETWIDLENEIFNVIEEINNDYNELYNYGYSNLRPSILSIQKNIEFSYENILHKLKQTQKRYIANKRGYNDKIKDNLNVFFEVYIQNYNGLINFLYDQLRDFTKLFEDYLDKVALLSIGKKVKYNFCVNQIKSTSERKELYILNFNYTNTSERLYKQGYNIKSIYIHGKIQNGDNCNLILGTHSFNNEKIPVEFNIFKKHHQRHRYGTIEPYQDLLKKIKKSASKPIFHIVGHSLDITDRAILKHLLLVNDNALTLINIYYHDEEALVRMQSNIDIIIGEEEVMAKVRFIPQHDPKRGILIPKENIS